MALSFLYRLIRRTIELLGVHHLSGIEKDVEIIVLRHQLEVPTATHDVLGSPGPTERSSLLEECSSPATGGRR